ncbi:MAG: 1-deoxy-D-xylulose-5-phosphate reductoisomerase, partial [Acidimicrobiia bacterium]|nr:1-deoxy-D-xylulose-5-phosphate reductoisomerase [Acidimicrobiia bacterium]
AAFLGGRIPWTGIAQVLKTAMDHHDGTEMDSAEAVVDVDRQARARAERIIERMTA